MQDTEAAVIEAPTEVLDLDTVRENLAPGGIHLSCSQLKDIAHLAETKQNEKTFSKMKLTATIMAIALSSAAVTGTAVHVVHHNKNNNQGPFYPTIFEDAATSNTTGEGATLVATLDRKDALRAWQDALAGVAIVAQAGNGEMVNVDASGASQTTFTDGHQLVFENVIVDGSVVTIECNISEGDDTCSIFIKARRVLADPHKLEAKILFSDRDLAKNCVIL